MEAFIKEILDNSGKVYEVGGCVRDRYIGRESKDIDLVVTGIPMVTLHDILKKYGILDTVGNSFAVTKFKPFGHTGEPYDIALPRIDTLGDPSKGHHGIIATHNHNLKIEDDLYRRDFTINAMAIDLSDNKLIDLFGGMEDINNKIIRPVSDETFIDDPLRILRAIQFSARFGFDISEKCLCDISNNKHMLSTISSERILSEIDKVYYKGDHLFLRKLLEDLYIFGLRDRPDMNINNIHDFRYFIFDTENYIKLNGEALTIRYMQCLDKLSILGDDEHMQVFNMLQKCNMLLETGLNSKYDLTKFRTGEFPIAMKHLNIESGYLMNKGFLNKALGDKQKELLQDVFNGTRKNILCDLIK